MASPDLQTHTAPGGDPLRLIVEASGILLGARTVEEVLPRVLALARETLAADAYALWRFDPTDAKWSVAATEGLSDEYVHAATEAIRGFDQSVPLDELIVVEEIATADWLRAEHREAHLREGTRAMLVTGLRRHEETLGTLVFYYRESHAFGERELDAASTLANLAATAIANADLLATQVRMAQERAFVAEVSGVLASSLDYEVTLKNVAAAAVPRFADWCAIDLVGEDGALARLVTTHADPAKVRWAEELRLRYPQEPETGPLRVVRTQEPELYSEISDKMLTTALSGQPEYLEIIRRLGLQSLICVPLVARGRAFGAITFVSAESGRHYEHDDLELALDLARRAAVAVDNALLYREAEQARSEAQESLAQLNAAFTTAPVALAFLDRELRYVRVNEVLAQMNGLPAEDHVGRRARDVLPEGVGERAESMHRRVLESGEAILEIPVKRRLATTPGEDRELLASYYPVRGSNGDVIGVGVVGIDVTERERMRAEAEVVRERLSVLAEASQQLASTLDYETTLANIASLLVPRYADWYAVDILDRGGRFRRIAVVHRDPGKAEWSARSRREYPPQLDEPEGPGRVVRSGEAVLYREVPDELLASSTRDPRHHRILRELGMASAMVVPLRAGGRVFGTLMLVSADSARPYDEDDLDFAQHLARRAAVAVDNALLYRTAQERGHAALVVEHVADGVALVDSLGVIRLWNPAAERITGLSAANVLNVAADAVFPSWESILALAQKKGARVETQPMEINGRELWLSLSGVAFDEGTVFAFRDLTAEREVERLKSDFVATISHELRTPLAAIYGAALTIRRRDVLLAEPQRSGLLEVIANESDRLARIVNDILWASRLESGTMQTRIERCDAVALAREIVDAATQYSPPNVRLAFDSPADAPAVACDPDKVRQVIGNLVDNAIKYSPDGGTVSVTAEVVGDRLRFVVGDEGLGIPLEEQERIFEKFYRLDPNLTRGVGGTGLGLYISRELVERMGGRIWVESDGAGGSTFFFDLPIA
jgi:PAS domain S-box-containing protein